MQVREPQRRHQTKRKITIEQREQLLLPLPQRKMICQKENKKTSQKKIKKPEGAIFIISFFAFFFCLYFLIQSKATNGYFKQEEAESSRR